VYTKSVSSTRISEPASLLAFDVDFFVPNANKGNLFVLRTKGFSKVYGQTSDTELVRQMVHDAVVSACSQRRTSSLVHAQKGKRE
jgi:hypothetical protein